MVILPVKPRFSDFVCENQDFQILPVITKKFQILPQITKFSDLPAMTSCNPRFHLLVLSKGSLTIPRRMNFSNNVRKRLMVGAV